MAPEIPLENQRPAEYVFSRHVEQALTRIKARKQEPWRDGGGRGGLKCNY